MMQVMITGASRGIGKALRQQYSKRGADVLGTTRGAAQDGLVTLDVTDPASIRALAKTRGDAPLDLLVCNAGVLLDRDEGLDHGYPADLWAETFAVNVTGVFLTVQAMLPALRAAKGRIAIISSQLGSSGIASGGRYAYRASKAAALNIGRNLAVDLRGDGIAVGIYHPGWVQTDMGGGSADLTPGEAARGLAECFDRLSLADSGTFRTWDGRTHPL